MISPDGRLPVWIKTQDGGYVQVDKLSRLTVRENRDNTYQHSIVGHVGIQDYTLATFPDEDQAQEALDHLVLSVLPVAIVSMDLDVIAVLEDKRKAHQP